MVAFRNILVGVCLTKCKETGTPVLDFVGEHAFLQARWLARQSRAALAILMAWDLDGGVSEEAARDALAGLASQAKGQGIETREILVPGQGCFEMIRQVRSDDHDLTVVGTHEPHGLKRLLLGSDAGTLLQECPCPVWVSKPGPEIYSTRQELAHKPEAQAKANRSLAPQACVPVRSLIPRNILVATDLSPLSDEVVRIGLAVGELAGAHTHVLDVIEYPLDRLWSPMAGDSASRKYHLRVRGEAEQALLTQIERSEGHEPKAAVTIHVADGDGIPDHAIVKFIGDHNIDLLVLGTFARHGLARLVLGNTAERLLPEVPCSVLAIKPADFGKK